MVNNCRNRHNRLSSPGQASSPAAYNSVRPKGGLAAGRKLPEVRPGITEYAEVPRQTCHRRLAGWHFVALSTRKLASSDGLGQFEAAVYCLGLLLLLVLPTLVTAVAASGLVLHGASAPCTSSLSSPPPPSRPSSPPLYPKSLGPSRWSGPIHMCHNISVRPCHGAWRPPS